MRTLALALGLMAAAATVEANSTCTSILTADQLHDLNVMIFPGHPFSPHLTEAVEGDQGQGAVRRLSRKSVDMLRGALAHPYSGVAGFGRGEVGAALRTWLQSNASGQLPAWDDKAGDDLSISPWVPREWSGRTAEGFIDLLKANGNAGPLNPATLAAVTTRGREIGLTQFLATDKSGRDKYMWAYIYRATVNGRLLTTLLAMCEADVIVMSADEVDVREMEQQLAKAWPTRDRLTIERILAREWSITMPDAITISRAALLAATFDRSERIVENMTTNDDAVTVRLFDEAAVVRGRTVTTFAIGGVRQTTTVQFTDMFVKRDGTWKLIASHQTNVSP